MLTRFLEDNARTHPSEIALVEINPSFEPESRITWREYSLMQPIPGQPFRREMTWRGFDLKANRFANLLMTRGCRKGQKVAILLMNSLDGAIAGILKAGAVAVPLNSVPPRRSAYPGKVRPSMRPSAPSS